MDTLWIAVPLAGILLFSAMTRVKFELGSLDFNRFVDTCTIFLAAAIVYALADDAQNAIWFLLKWIPLIFYPIMAAQLFSIAGKIDVKSFFLTARKSVSQPDIENKKIDISYMFALLCILSTGSSTDTGVLFFWATAFFCVWGLWNSRSARVSQGVWVLVLFLALFFGYAGQKALFKGSRHLSRWMFLQYSTRVGNDPFASHTSLGDIGKLKLSGKILIRAEFDFADKGRTYLLYNGIYNHLFKNNWYAGYTFAPVLSEDEAKVWQINPKAEQTKKVKLYFRSERKKAVLSLPAGTTQISGFTADSCRKNANQVVRFENTPPLIAAKINFTGKPAWDKAPDKVDLSIPKRQADLISSVGNSFSFEEKSPDEVINTLKNYFEAQFSYSLELKGKGTYPTALHNFLSNTRQGHCELFATATVLLLRQAGIPARYVTGFIAHEYSSFENRLLIRQRDAHAWVRVFVNGRWQDLDTTPGNFLNIDARSYSGAGVSDLFSYLGFALSRLRHEIGKDFLDRYGLLLIVPLLGMLFLRLRKGGRIKKVAQKNERDKNRHQGKRQVSFYLLEAVMAEKGHPRKGHETYLAWLDRIRPVFGKNRQYKQLLSLLAAHNRLFFGEKIEPDNTEQLTFAIEKWIERFESENSDYEKSVI